MGSDQRVFGRVVVRPRMLVTEPLAGERCCALEWV